MGKHKVSSNVLQLNVKKKEKKGRDYTSASAFFEQNRGEIGKEKRPFFEDVNFIFRGVQGLNFHLSMLLFTI